MRLLFRRLFARNVINKYDLKKIIKEITVRKVMVTRNNNNDLLYQRCSTEKQFNSLPARSVFKIISNYLCNGLRNTFWRISLATIADINLWNISRFHCRFYSPQVKWYMTSVQKTLYISCVASWDLRILGN